MKNNSVTAEDIRFLREAVSKAGSEFNAYRKISIVWGIIIILDGIGSQLLVRTGQTGFIPLVWLPTVAAEF